MRHLSTCLTAACCSSPPVGAMPGTAATLPRSASISPGRRHATRSPSSACCRSPTTGSPRRRPHPDRAAGQPLRRGHAPNAAGTPIDPARVEPADGFSPGSMLLAHVPAPTSPAGAAPVTDVGGPRNATPRSSSSTPGPGSAGRTGPNSTRAPPTPRRRMLIVRPAKNFLEGHRYAVALRRLEDAAGEPAARVAGASPRSSRRARTAGPTFVRGGRAGRRFGDLARARGGTRGLHLAWDFTVASEQGIAGPRAAMRDEALGRSARRRAALHGHHRHRSPPSRQRGARGSRGEFPVPQLPRPATAARHRLQLRSRRTATAVSRHARPRSSCARSRVRRSSAPRDPSLYGHGLLGSPRGDGIAHAPMAGEHDFMFCATDWIGMAEEDIANATRSRGPLEVRTVADRLQQSLLDFVFLGRLMITRTASRATRRSRTTAQPADRRGPSSSSTATARAASRAARSSPSRRTYAAACSAWPA